VSRKLAKQKVLPFAILLIILFVPGIGMGSQKIKTAQHIIVIDPGHGGAEKGLVLSESLQEKTITLSLSQKIAQDLETRYNVYLTRTSDISVPPRDRVCVANQNQADLYISIHLNNERSASALFYYFAPPLAGDAENNSAQIPWKMQAMVFQEKSKLAARSFSDIFTAHKKEITVISSGLPLILLEGAAMPAILIEPLSISELSLKPETIDEMITEYSRLISESIDRYFDN
jgi:N-acetylmuramoyl-L-alanine amidase